MATSALRRANVEKDLVPLGIFDSGLSFSTSGFFSSAFSSRFRTCQSRISIARSAIVDASVPLGLVSPVPLYLGPLHP